MLQVRERVWRLLEDDESYRVILLARGSGGASEGDGGVMYGNADSSLMKKVRIVSSVEYYLEK